MKVQSLDENVGHTSELQKRPGSILGDLESAKGILDWKQPALKEKGRESNPPGKGGGAAWLRLAEKRGWFTTSPNVFVPVTSYWCGHSRQACANGLMLCWEMCKHAVSTLAVSVFNSGTLNISFTLKLRTVMRIVGCTFLLKGCYRDDVVIALPLRDGHS